VIELCCIRLIDGVSCHMTQCFRILPRLDQYLNIGIGALLRSNFVTNVTC